MRRKEGEDCNTSSKTRACWPGWCGRCKCRAHFAAGQYATARRDFKDLEVGGIYRREAQWFGMLAEMTLPGADKNTWVNTLQRIRKDPKHPYQKAAETLWKQVGNRDK